MRKLRMAIVAALAAAPALLASVPAEALMAHQYAHQGHGRYTNSSGSRMRPMLRHHRFHSVRPRRHHRG